MLNIRTMQSVAISSVLLIAIPVICIAQDSISDDGENPAVAELFVPNLLALEAEMAAIESVWYGYHDALKANDIEAALAHINPDARDRYSRLFEDMGSHLLNLATNWKDLTPISIGDEVAYYAFNQIEDGKERGYSVMFVRHPELGWVIQQM